METSIPAAALSSCTAAEKESFNREESHEALYADLVSLKNDLNRKGSGTENARWTRSAAEALIQFADLNFTGQDNCEPVRDIVVDLMADIMHLCRALGVTSVEPFMSLVESATRHYEAEVDEEMQEIFNKQVTEKID